jgi:hypothetical protein
MGLLALLLGAATVQAQPAPALQAAAPAWRSAFDGYRPFSAEKTLPWREANDTVHGIGGWRAYAREAAQPAAIGASAPAPKPAASAPAGAHHLH